MLFRAFHLDRIHKCSIALWRVSPSGKAVASQATIPWVRIPSPALFKPVPIYGLFSLPDSPFTKQKLQNHFIAGFPVMLVLRFLTGSMLEYFIGPYSN